ncbi:MAG: Uma2 family endonuclease [Dehalococcoidia bacterium]
MVDIHLREPPVGEIPPAPTEDDLPYSDGIPMESIRHVLQMYLLMDTLTYSWRERDDLFVGGNMFVYYSPDQLLNEDFRGPDVFVVTGARRRERKSWLVWQEGKAPDVVIELLSPTTAHRDRTEKKEIYRDRLRVTVYVLYDPYTAELEGYVLRDGAYEPIMAGPVGQLPCAPLGLSLVRWDGEWKGEEARWLRWATADGTLLPTPIEDADEAGARADEAEAHAHQADARADEAEARADEAEARADEAEREAAAERQRADEAERAAAAERRRAAELEARLADLERRGRDQ